MLQVDCNIRSSSYARQLCLILGLLSAGTHPPFFSSSMVLEACLPEVPRDGRVEVLS